MADRGDVVVRQRGPEQVGIVDRALTAGIADPQPITRAMVRRNPADEETLRMNLLAGGQQHVVVEVEKIDPVGAGLHHADVPLPAGDFVRPEHGERIAVRGGEDRLHRPAVHRFRRTGLPAAAVEARSRHADRGVNHTVSKT